MRFPYIREWVCTKMMNVYEDDECVLRWWMCTKMMNVYQDDEFYKDLTFFVCLIDHFRNSLRQTAQKSLSAVSLGWMIPSYDIKIRSNFLYFIWEQVMVDYNNIRVNFDPLHRLRPARPWIPHSLPCCFLWTSELTASVRAQITVLLPTK